MKSDIYKRALNSSYLECTCAGISIDKYDELFKNAVKADKRLISRVALNLGIINKFDFRQLLKNSKYNPYCSYRTNTHLIYCHSEIDYFIKVQ